ncbi:MAG TPA: hypothetical protein VG711_12095 [Phycisphaerales bacterium]|nr:hypothetical protein [Phycisphaerales bacterium]
MLSNIFIYIVWLIVVLICAILFFLARSQFRGDLSKGRRRCPKCWFDMSHATSLICSECGHTVLSEADLYRSRRYPIRASLSILSIVIIILLVNFQLSSRRWTSYLPTGVLLTALPLASSPTSEIYRELLTRISANRLSAEQYLTFINRTVTGDFTASPPSDAWIAKYGDVLNSGRIRLATDPTVIAALDSIPPRIDLFARSPWPADVEPVLSLRMRDWWSLGYECRVIIQPACDDPALAPFPPAAYIRRPNDLFAPALPITLPKLPAGKHHLNINIKIERRRAPQPNPNSASSSLTSPTDEDIPTNDPTDPPVAESLSDSNPWQLAATLNLPLDLDIQSPRQLALAPAASDDLTAAMRKVFQAGVTKWPTGPSPVRFFFDPTATFTADFADTAVGVRLELRHNDALARRLDLWWIAGTQTTDRAFGWMASLEDIDLLSQLTPNDTAWSMTITGDPALALRAGSATKYWSGSFTLPVPVRSANAPAPPRAWTVDPSGSATQPEAH